MKDARCKSLNINEAWNDYISDATTGTFKTNKTSTLKNEKLLPSNFLYLYLFFYVYMNSDDGTLGPKHAARAVFTNGPKGPGPSAANFQGWHIKKNRV
jgi:hypothetical protein